MLDKRKDYGTIMGEGNAKFFQFGRYYDAQHREVTEHGKPVKGATVPTPEPEVSPETPDTTVTDAAPETGPDENDRVDTDQVADAAPEVTDAAPDADQVTDAAPDAGLDENGQVDDVDLESLSWREIKTRVEGAGGNWTNKAEGIVYLRSL